VQEKIGIEEIHLTNAAKHFLVSESQDPTNRALGARALRRVFEQRVEDPIIALLDRGEDGGLIKGDRVWVDIQNSNETKNTIVISKEKH